MTQSHPEDANHNRFPHASSILCATMVVSLMVAAIARFTITDTTTLRTGCVVGCAAFIMELSRIGGSAMRETSRDVHQRVADFAMIGICLLGILSIGAAAIRIAASSDAWVNATILTSSPG